MEVSKMAADISSRLSFRAARGVFVTRLLELCHLSSSIIQWTPRRRLWQMANLANVNGRFIRHIQINLADAALVSKTKTTL